MASFVVSIYSMKPGLSLTLSYPVETTLTFAFGTHMYFSSCRLSLSHSSYGSRDSYWSPLSLSSLTSRKHETWLETVGCLTFYTFLVDMFTSIPTHLSTTVLNFHIFRNVSELNQTSFSEINNTFLVESANLSSVSVVSTLLGHSFAFVNTYKHMMASNNEMHVNLTFGRKHEKSIQTDCKWTFLHYTGYLLLSFTSIGPL